MSAAVRFHGRRKRLRLVGSDTPEPLVADRVHVDGRQEAVHAAEASADKAVSVPPSLSPVAEPVEVASVVASPAWRPARLRG